MKYGGQTVAVCPQKLHYPSWRIPLDRPRIVNDTNVLVAALRSDEGSANRLLMLVGEETFDICLSVPLLLEYEEVCKRLSSQLSWTSDDVDYVLDHLCRVAFLARIDFKWPVLSDRDDEMVLELAIAAGCDCIVTFNTSNFRGASQFGMRICTPFEFLQSLRAKP